ncbi:MAG: type II toxin-antitoxin system RelE/ParE family toxin [bacterium]
MNFGDYKLLVFFFRTERRNEPVRKWIKSLSKDDKRTIGEDIKTIQFGWPLGMPLVEKISPNLWEVRTKIKNGIARIIFTIDVKKIILLHGFIKKTKKIPKRDLEIAKSRLKLYQEGKNERK